MIKLYSKRMLTADRGGTRQPFDLEKLQHDLQLSFTAAGITEHWLAEHLLLILEEQLAEGPAEIAETNQDIAGVDRLLIRILKDAGYPDVALDFACRRGLTASEHGNPKRKPWDPGRLRTLLGERLQVSPNGAAALAEAVAEILTAARFVRASDSLILEIGEHVLAERACQEREHAAPSPAGGWLMPAGYWSAFFSAETARLMNAGVVKAHPLSKLFPVVRISFDAMQLARQLGGGHALTELEFVPAFRHGVSRAFEAVITLRNHAADTMPGTNRPAYLMVHGLGKVVRQRLGRTRQPDAEAMLSELNEIIRECAVEDNGRILVSVL